MKTHEHIYQFSRKNKLYTYCHINRAVAASLRTQQIFEYRPTPSENKAAKDTSNRVINMQGLQSSALVPPQPAKPVQPENEQQLNEPQQRTQAIEALASSKANQFTQQTQQPQSQQQYQHHYPSDPRQLMLPLQHPQTPISSVDEHTFQNSDVSTEHSSRYFTRSLSTSWPLSNNHNLHQYQSQREYQRGVPPTSTSLTSASGHLALPAEDTNNSNRPRRWSLTGRFFGDRNRRKV
ncbi:hypothetical protein BCR41DRAFT_109725 [Lobosporangium transversale]|uniref:Uncharacterized protein n=1 Tax=Lobosporangium transversale TaxID=64571 RepID=A0A1Y2GIN9_9FUNG|nr:hypothetical protein BCR41DRAFT_113584 [Lobosporangium transversale]XP_021879876.1 hypothetical protein BCR41DRAFT_109725 [Lobosporangium transversale]ORZ10915.1 hypothetical protein BCR41DRAFT_113584 [Lobosporangium transversale]ORZ11779.1 hypothetical protein BCR41DRAFT_109725 [Lobosporangium transversale]|eukprot:XP_021879432.1 hypothetical protein BCR41DRAFT_113584 [Lobosporangium transversale]